MCENARCYKDWGGGVEEHIHQLTRAKYTKFQTIKDWLKSQEYRVQGRRKCFNFCFLKNERKGHVQEQYSVIRPTAVGYWEAVAFLYVC